METNNEEQFVEFDEILNFIHENTGFDKEVIEKVLDAETRFLIKSGIATELKEQYEWRCCLYYTFQESVLALLFSGRMAQLAAAPDLGSGFCRFESYYAHFFIMSTRSMCLCQQLRKLSR